MHPDPITFFNKTYDSLKSILSGISMNIHKGMKTKKNLVLQNVNYFRTVVLLGDVYYLTFQGGDPSLTLETLECE